MSETPQLSAGTTVLFLIVSFGITVAVAIVYIAQIKDLGSKSASGAVLRAVGINASHMLSEALQRLNIAGLHTINAEKELQVAHDSDLMTVLQMLEASADELGDGFAIKLMTQSGNLLADSDQVDRNVNRPFAKITDELLVRESVRMASTSLLGEFVDYSANQSAKFAIKVKDYPDLTLLLTKSV